MRSFSARVKTALLRLLLIASAATQYGCGTLHANQVAAAATPTRTPGHPPLTVIARDGDPAGAIAIAVWTEGIDRENGAEATAGLFGLVQSRLVRSGVPADILAGREGYRIRIRMTGGADPMALIRQVHRSLTAVVNSDSSDDLDAARAKVKALRARPMPDPGYSAIAECDGELFGEPVPSLADRGMPTAETVDRWRSAAHTAARITVSVVGTDAFARAIEAAVAETTEPWPDGPAVQPPPPREPPRLSVFPLSGYRFPASGPTDAARVTIMASTSSPRAMAAAHALSDRRGALALRLSSADRTATIREVKTTVHREATCLKTEVAIARDAHGPPSLAKVAALTALVRQEMELALVETQPMEDGTVNLARQEPDALDAADRAAWGSMVHRDQAAKTNAVTYSTAVAVGAGFLDTPKDNENALLALLAKELDQATIASQSRRIESRTKVEPGQGELWVLVGSPCGVFGEDSRTAGVSATVVVAEALQANAYERSGIHIDPWVSADGVGLIGHAPAVAGESPDALARRVADAVARPFLAETLEPWSVKSAQESLIVESEQASGLLASAVARALSPEYPSHLAPNFTPERSFAVSDAAVALRAKALRGGPLRVAVLSNYGQKEAEQAVRAADRWVPHGFDGGACERRPDGAPAHPRPPRGPAMISVTLPPHATSVGLIAVPLTGADEILRTYAELFASMLNAKDGLLTRAVVQPKLALRAYATVVGSRDSGAALVIRTDAEPAMLDAAMVQARALLDRLGKGGISAEDVTAGMAEQATAEARQTAVPRGRLLQLFGSRPASPVGAPVTLDAVKEAAAKLFADETVVLVSGRPR